jgi:hypothetical protein
MKYRGLRVALIVIAPALCLVVGVLVLHSEGSPSLAEGLELSAAGAWPPMPRSLSTAPSRYYKAANVQANANGILVVWSEGSTSPNGQVWFSWSNGSSWETRRIDWDTGGYASFSPSAVLQGTTAHFLWVGQTGSDYVIFYRSRNLAAGSWSSVQQIYRSNDPDPVETDEFGNAQLAVTSDGVRHAVWTAKTLVEGLWRDRIYYSNGVNGSWLLPERLTGYRLDLLTDNNDLSQDMPALVADGNELYVAWREKAQGETRRGIYVRRRNPSSGDWEPGSVSAGDQVMGYRISDDRFDEFPAMAAAGDRLCVVWDRFLRTEKDAFENNFRHVYSMTYRVQTGADVTTSWWPPVTEAPGEIVLGDDTPIAAWSYVTTADGQLDPDFLVPMPDDYYSGARPQIGLIGATAPYTPYVVWHHWDNTGPDANAVGPAAPYHVLYSYVYEGDQGTAHWEDPEIVRFMGSEGNFASPAMVLAPDIDSPHNLHLALNVRSGEEPAPWHVLYTNLGQYYWIQLPLVLRGY